MLFLYVWVVNITQNRYKTHLNKLNFQRPTISWKLFSGRTINAVMTALASRIAEHRHVALSNNFILGSAMTKYASTNSVWKFSF